MPKYAPVIQNDEQEYRVIRRDLTFVVVMSLIFLGILVGLYFYNRATGQVDAFFANLLKF